MTIKSDGNYERRKWYMNEVYAKLNNCLESVREKTDFVPEIALILGSGLGEYAEEIKVETSIDYKDIEGFPVSTVAGHKGRFVFGYVNDVPVVIMQGRVHFYEGYPMTDVVLPARLMGLLGAKVLFLTNACGGVNKEFKAGDLMFTAESFSRPSERLQEKKKSALERVFTCSFPARHMNLRQRYRCAAFWELMR